MTETREMSSGLQKNRERVLVGQRDDDDFQYVAVTDDGEVLFVSEDIEGMLDELEEKLWSGEDSSGLSPDADGSAVQILKLHTEELEAIEEAITEGYDSATIVPNADGSAIEILRWLSTDTQKHTSGTLTADGTEQTLYEKEDADPWTFLGGHVSLAEMVDNDGVTIRTYLKLTEGGDWLIDMEDDYDNEQDPVGQLVWFDRVNSLGVRITIEQTADHDGYQDFEYQFSEVSQ